MIGSIRTSVQLQLIITARNQWLPKTCSIPYWTTSVFSSTVTNDELRISELLPGSPFYCDYLERRLSDECSLSVKVTLRRTVNQLSLGVEPHLGLMTRYLLLFDSYGLVFVGRPLRREDRSVVCNCCWPSSAQSFSGPSPLGLALIFYCLRYETSLFVTSYDSQGYGGSIRPRLHTGVS
jgi:hypothetical protein